MKISKTLLNAILVAVTIGTMSACTKSVESKANKHSDKKNPKTENTDSTQQTGSCCPACGMG